VPKSRLLKGLKISLVVIGILLLLFGGIGGIIELSADQAEVAGLILSPLFIGLGILLIYIGLRKPSPPKPIRMVEKERYEASLAVQKEIPKEPLVEQKNEETTYIENSPWQKKLLIISAYIELIFIVLIFVAAVFFGYAGIESGGMGVIIGFTMFITIIIFSAIMAVRIVSLWGIQKNKRWATLINLGSMILLTIILLFILNPLCIYTGFATWASYSLSKHPSYT